MVDGPRQFGGLVLSERDERTLREVLRRYSDDRYSAAVRTSPLTGVGGLDANDMQASSDTYVVYSGSSGIPAMTQALPGIQTACCAPLIPSVLTLTVSGGGGSSNVTYSEFTQTWTDESGSAYILSCVGAAWNLRVEGGPAALSSAVCSPLQLVFTYGSQTYTITGVSIPSQWQPGSSLCNVYSLDLNYAAYGLASPGLRELPFQKLVFNIATSAVPPQTFIQTIRDKYGNWYAVSGAEGGGTGPTVALPICVQVVAATNSAGLVTGITTYNEMVNITLGAGSSVALPGTCVTDPTCCKGDDTCSACPDSVAPAAWNCAISGVVNGGGACTAGTGCTSANKTYFLQYQGNCIWDGEEAWGFICGGLSGGGPVLSYTGGQWVFSSVEIVGGASPWTLQGTFNCLGVNIFTGTFSTIYCSGTLTAVISPA
jgi:hypothetical protein